MRLAKCFGTRFRKAEVFHLALPDQFRHGAHRIFDRNVRIDAMLIEQVDDIDAKAFEGGFGNGAHIFRAAVRAHHHLACRFAGVDFETELGGDDHLVAIGLQAFADEDFIVVRPINLCRIEKGDAEFDGAVQRCNCAALIAGRAIGMGHAHAAEAERRNGKVVSKGSFFHLFVLPKEPPIAKGVMRK